MGASSIDIQKRSELLSALLSQREAFVKACLRIQFRTPLEQNMTSIAKVGQQLGSGSGIVGFYGNTVCALTSLHAEKRLIARQGKNRVE